MPSERSSIGGNAPRDPTKTIRPESLEAPENAHLPVARVGGDAEPDFVVDSVIGRGGMGIVETASQTSLGREVALKRLVEPGDEYGFRALLREARIASRLQHPGIVPIHAIFHDEQLGPVVVMKHLEGTTWRKTLAAHGADQDPRAHARVAIGVCFALEYAHSHGVLHLDVKPDNVIVGNFGEVWLVDWGIAHDQNADPPRTEPLGTPAYMAPEMVRPTEVAITERSDVYLVGACLYEALYGIAPHGRDDSNASMAAAHDDVEFPDDSIGWPTELVGIARKALAADPADRFGSIRELREALQNAMEHEDAERLVTGAMSAMRALPLEADIDALSAIEVQLQSALSLWSENPRGIAARRQLQRRTLAWCLGEGDLHTARRLADQIGPLPLELQEGLDTLESIRAAERAALDQRRIHLDGDGVERHRRLRKWATGAIVAGMAGIPFIMHARNPGNGPSPAAELLFLSFIPLAFWTTILVAWRKRFLSNYANRAATSAVTAAFACAVLNRAIGYAGASDPYDILLRELFLFAGIMGAQASLHRAFTAIGLMYATAWSVAVLVPDSARYLYNLCLFLNAALLYWVWHDFDEV